MKDKSSDYIQFFDTTLRDGEQTPSVSLTLEDKIEIARQLSKLGVDVIEAGSPMSSPGEKRVVKEIAKAGLEAEICGLARATKSDIDDSLDCDVDVVHIFIPTCQSNSIHIVTTGSKKIFDIAWLWRIRLCRSIPIELLASIQLTSP